MRSICQSEEQSWSATTAGVGTCMRVPCLKVDHLEFKPSSCQSRWTACPVWPQRQPVFIFDSEVFILKKRKARLVSQADFCEITRWQWWTALTISMATAFLSQHPVLYNITVPSLRGSVVTWLVWSQLSLTFGSVPTDRMTLTGDLTWGRTLTMECTESVLTVYRVLTSQQTQTVGTVLDIGKCSEV